jgi:hypothetical protein
MSEERRQISRRRFSYYMCVTDDATGKLLGHLSDISTGGFKLDSVKPVPINTDFRLRVEQTGQISNKSYIALTARARWCRVDGYDPNIYNVGFQITSMTPVDHDVFAKMFSTYGVQKPSQDENSGYL